MRELVNRYEEQAVLLKGAKEDNAAAAAQSALRVAGASSWTWARAAAGRRAERGASPSAGSAAPSVRSQETKDTAMTFSALTEDSHDERQLCSLPTSLGTRSGSPLASSSGSTSAPPGRRQGTTP